MRKHQELTDPRSCLSKAHENEMLFVLLGRDAAAAATVEFWVNERIRRGMNRLTDVQITEALNCAQVMKDERQQKEGQ
jgi:hypothetical protein